MICTPLKVGNVFTGNCPSKVPRTRQPGRPFSDEPWKRCPELSAFDDRFVINIGGAILVDDYAPRETTATRVKPEMWLGF